jgi:Matrixin
MTSVHWDRFPVRLLTVIAAFAASLLGARVGHAYCLAVTEPVPDGWPQDTECFRGSDAALEVYWKNACASYSLQQDASRQVSFDQAREVAAKAFLAWKNVDCPQGGHPSIDATHDMSPVQCSAVQYNPSEPNQNVIVFRDDAWPHPGQFNTLGLTRLKYGVTSGEIFDADMEINSADHTLIAEGTPANDNEILLESVMTHEAGHFLGLGHSTVAGAIMYAKYHGEPLTLSEDDKAGICAIYPPDGTRRPKQALPLGVQQEPCNPDPRQGFSGACGSPDGGGTVNVEEVPVHRSSCSVCSVPSSRSPASEGPLFGLLGWVWATMRRSRIKRSPWHK